MRAHPLGHWMQYAWHAGALALIALAVALSAAMALSLTRDEMPLAARRLRWEIVGWTAVMASLLSVCVWPYLTAFARIRVEASGAWRLENYLGYAVAELPPREPRALLAEDLGGHHVGVGRVYVRRADGTLIPSVRTTEPRFTQARKLMGYAEGDVRDVGGSLAIPTHRFTARGPAMHEPLASRE